MNIKEKTKDLIVRILLSTLCIMLFISGAFLGYKIYSEKNQIEQITDSSSEAVYISEPDTSEVYQLTDTETETYVYTNVSEESNAQIFYVTASGTKYHLESCSYLNKSKISKTLSEVIAEGYEPCSRCKP